jgi:ribonuclease HI
MSHKKQPKWYAVKQGRCVGIYRTWDECKTQVNGYSGAVYKSFDTEAEAIAFIGPLGSVNTTPVPVQLPIDQVPVPVQVPVQAPTTLNTENTTTLNTTTINVQTTAVTNTINVAKRMIYVDGGCNKHTHPNAWGRVVDEQGSDLLYPNRHLLSDMDLQQKVLPAPIGQTWVIVCRFQGVTQQNNGAELLAAIAGMRIALATNPKQPTNVASDSSLIVEHWSKNKGALTNNSTKSFQTILATDPQKAEYIMELTRLSDLGKTVDIQLIKISGDHNPADLGYHL